MNFTTVFDRFQQIFASGRMNRRVLSHALVIASLIGMYIYSAFVVHGPRYSGDGFFYVEQALSIFRGSQLSEDALPLYPLWLNLLMHIDPACVDYLQCMCETLPRWPAWDLRWGEHFGDVVKGKRGVILAVCRPWDNIGFYAQALLGAIGIGLVWIAGWLASGRFAIAHISAFVALYLDRYLLYSTAYRPENLVIPLFGGVNVCLAYLALGRARTMPQRVVVAITCGLLLGALILTRPPYEFLLVALSLAAAIYAFRNGARRREITVAIAGILISALLVIAPWAAYNYKVRGFVGLSKGYALGILAERLTFNAMTGRQWLAAFPFWTSEQRGETELGDNWVTKLFGAETTAPLDKRHPDYFTRGKRVHEAKQPYKDALANGYLSLLGRILSDLPKHFVTSVPLAWRGMSEFTKGPTLKSTFYVLLIFSFVYGTHRNRSVLAALAFCPVVVLAINALVSVNINRYNIGLVTPLSVGVALPIAWAIDGAWNRLRRRFVAPARERAKKRARDMVSGPTSEG